MVIKLQSTSFILVLQNCPIRILYLLNMTFWLDVFWVWIQNSYQYSKNLWLWGLDSNLVCQWVVLWRFYQCRYIICSKSVMMQDLLKFMSYCRKKSQITSILINCCLLFFRWESDFDCTVWSLATHTQYYQI